MRSTGLKGSSATPRDSCTQYSEYRCGPGISVTALLQQLQWPSLADRRLIARLTLFYNAHTGKINIPLCNIIDRSDSRTRGAKNNYKYISTKKNTALGQSFVPKTQKKIGISMKTIPKNPLPPYCLRTVSGPHTANAWSCRGSSMLC